MRRKAAASAAVRELVHRYCNALDVGDVEGVVGCFSPDAEVSFQGGAFRLDGHDDLRAFFVAREGPKHQGFSELRGSLHVVANCVVDLGPRAVTARTSTHALVLHHGIMDGREVIVHRGVRYVDEFRSVRGTWSITRREHAPMWHVVTHA